MALEERDSKQAHGGQSTAEQGFPVKLASFSRTDIPVSVDLPAGAGGYVLMAEFSGDGIEPVVSRRFIKVGQLDQYLYYKLDPQQCK